jgi:Tfp pilus assembly protein PilE
LAVIASLIIPSYKKLIGKTRQTEARVVLQSIYTAQNIHFSQNEAYAKDIKSLDIEIPADSRYSYSIQVNNSGYTATATANIDSDITIDKWTINQKKTIENLVNDIYE